MLGATWTDPGVVIGGGALFTLVGTALAIIAKLASSVPVAYRDQVAALAKDREEDRERIAELQKANLTCELRVSMLVAAMRRAGVDIPREVFDA